MQSLKESGIRLCGRMALKSTEFKSSGMYVLAPRHAHSGSSHTSPSAAGSHTVVTATESSREANMVV